MYSRTDTAKVNLLRRNGKVLPADVYNIARQKNRAPVDQSLRKFKGWALTTVQPVLSSTKSDTSWKRLRMAKFLRTHQ